MGVKSFKKEFGEYYGDYVYVEFDTPEEAKEKIKHLIDEEEDIMVQFNTKTPVLIIDPDVLKRNRRYLFDLV